MRWRHSAKWVGSSRKGVPQLDEVATGNGCGIRARTAGLTAFETLGLLWESAPVGSRLDRPRLAAHGGAPRRAAGLAACAAAAGRGTADGAGRGIGPGRREGAR